MKAFILSPFALLLFFALPVFAGYSGLPKDVEANFGAIKKYPKASSILLWVKDAYTQNDDGRQVYERHEFRYMPDEAARDTWGDPRIAYVEGRQKVDVVVARSYTNDGRTVDARSAALNEVTPDELDHAPDFSGFEQLVVTLLGLENGCIAELHYKLTTDKPLYPWLWGRVYFREEVPTVARELSIQLPAGKVLNYKAANGVPEPVVSGSIYTWKMGEQSGYVADDLRGHRVLLPNVAFTMAANWNEVTAEFGKRIAAASGEVELPLSLKEKPWRGVEAASRLDSVKLWLHERFNEIEFDHPDFNISMRPASRVLESGYGNSLEMAILTAALSGRMGVKAQPAAWFAFEPPVPSLHDLTGGLVAAHVETGSVLGAPTGEFPAADLADATLLLKGETDFQVHPPEHAKHAELRVNLNIDATDADTLHGTGTLFASGLLTPYEALRTDPKARLEHLIAWSGFVVNNATVRTLSPESAEINFSFALASPDTADRYRLLSTSAIDLSQFAGNPHLEMERREFPHWVKLPGEISVHMEAPLPDGWTVSQRPPDVKRSWKEGFGTRSVNVTDGRIMVDEKLTLGSPWIASPDWPEFRSFLIETGDRPNNVVVFSPKISQ